MEPLEPEPKAALVAFGESMSPSDVDEARAWARLSTRLGPIASMPMTPPDGRLGFLAKLIGTAGAGVVIAALAGEREPIEPESVPPEYPAAPEPDSTPIATISSPSSVRRTAGPLVAQPFVDDLPPKTVSGALGGARKRRNSSSSVPAAALDDPAWLAEMNTLSEARAALARGDHALALARLDEHARRWPEGSFAEEGAASRVTALCGLGRHEEAVHAAAEFLRRFPSSPRRGAIERSCAGSEDVR